MSLASIIVQAGYISPEKDGEKTCERTWSRNCFRICDHHSPLCNMKRIGKQGISEGKTMVAGDWIEYGCSAIKHKKAGPRS